MLVKCNTTMSLKQLLHKIPSGTWSFHKILARGLSTKYILTGTRPFHKAAGFSCLTTLMKTVMIPGGFSLQNDIILDNDNTY